MDRKYKTNHKWLDEEIDYLRCNYRGTSESAHRLATKLGVTFYSVKGQLAKLGLLKQKSPPWTEKELELLGELIHTCSIKQVAKRLRRSLNAVKIKATRLKMGLRTRNGWYTKKEVAEILGVDHKWVQARIDSGALKAFFHNGRKPQKKGMSMWHINTEDFREYLINYSDELMGRNVDIQQVIWIVSNAGG